MRLGDDDDAADPEGIELVEDDIHDGGLRALGGLHHRRLHGLEAVDGLGVAIEQFEQQVSPQCVHSIAPPLVVFCPKKFSAESRSMYGQQKFIARKK
jgi:hypothetical protein